MFQYSIIIPAYCCENTLADTVGSVMRAGLSNYEILLIEDGSPDGTPALCDMLAKEYACVRCVHQKNAGVSAARNRGIQEAGGEYILFVDSDDALRPFGTETLRCLENGNPDMLIFGMVFQYRSKEALVREETLSVLAEKRYDRVSLAEDFTDVFYSNYLTPVWNKFIKRSLLTNHAIRFDQRLTNYEDLAFSLHVLSKCDSIAVVPQAYYLYQVDYDHDHTVDRIARIDDVIGNTDLIAEKFFELERAMSPEGTAIPDLRICLLNIYFELFRVKIQTTPLQAIRRYCADFCSDSYVKQCLAYSGELSPGNQRTYRWIKTENALAIWAYSRYRIFRHFVAKNVKRWLRRHLE